MPDLLFEIGTEELPASYAAGAIAQLPDLLRPHLPEDSVVGTLGTPRRLVAHVSGLPDKTPEKTTERHGPPTGAPDKAVAGFAKKLGLSVGDLRKVETDKGEKWAGDEKSGGEPMREVLARALPRVIDGISFPKSMRWASGDERFARPIRWILALLGAEIVEFTWGTLEATDTTRGHRFLSPNPIVVRSYKTYVDHLRAASVLVDPVERRETVWKEVERAAKAVGGAPERDDALLDTVAFLVEHPTGIAGSFDESLLEMPRPVLVTPMKHHQRYFPVIDKKGALMNYFVTVANTPPESEAVVAAGNEKVLRARLADAKFFYDEDLRTPLTDMAGALDRVVFQAKLGTYAEKVERIEHIAVAMADALGIAPLNVTAVRTAAQLCKADLNSKMVYEFPELQGIMGRAYALAAGMAPDVAEAIEQHHQTSGAEDLGALVSLADRIDTLAGIFGIGERATGSTDPYGLRRHAIAVLTILREKGWALSISEQLRLAATLLAGKVEDSAAAVNEALDFIRERFYHLMIGEGLLYDAVDAVLAAGFDDVQDAWSRAQALTKLKASPDLVPVAEAFTRSHNILEKAPDNDRGADLDPGAFVDASEKSLHKVATKTAKDVRSHADGKDWDGALGAVVALRKPIDDFYLAVMVMDEDEGLRRNRLALLSSVVSIFDGIADFSKIVVEGK